MGSAGGRAAQWRAAVLKCLTAVVLATGAYVFYDNVDFSDGGVDNVQLRVNAQAATSEGNRRRIEGNSWTKGGRVRPLSDGRSARTPTVSTQRAV